MFQKILIPLDGSERAQAVLTHLSGFFTARAPEITVLGVVDGPNAPTIKEQALLESARERAQDYLETVVTRLADLGLSARLAVRIGRPAQTVVSEAETGGFDLIALASHGYAGLDRMFYGSTAEQVARHSLVPVLLVKSYQPEDDPANPYRPLAARPLTFDDLLVPLDGSKHAEWALPVATALAQEHSSRIHLVRVVPIVPRSSFFVPPTASEYDVDPEKAYLDELATRIRLTGIDVRCTVGQGAPVDFVRSYLRETPVDMVVMSTHGRSGWRRWVLGSVAEGLLRAVHTPILLRRLEEEN